MDDFGTGNASLALALDLPVDELKIDMSFVRGIQEKPVKQAMVQSIVSFAQNTEKETCIEGVEDKVLLDYLKKYHATGIRAIIIPGRYRLMSSRHYCMIQKKTTQLRRKLYEQSNHFRSNSLHWM